jgi:hypothetical protein
MVWKAQTTNSNYKVSVHLAEKINRGEDPERVSLVTTEIAAAGDGRGWRASGRSLLGEDQQQMVGE